MTCCDIELINLSTFHHLHDLQSTLRHRYKLKKPCEERNFVTEQLIPALNVKMFALKTLNRNS